MPKKNEASPVIGIFGYDEFLGGKGLTQAVSAARQDESMQVVVLLAGRRKFHEEGRIHNLLRRLEQPGEQLVLQIDDPEDRNSMEDRFLIVTVLRVPTDVIDATKLFARLPLPKGITLPQMVRALDEHLVRTAFEAGDRNRTHAARLLGISTTSFSERAARYGLPPSPPGNFSRSKKKKP